MTSARSCIRTSPSGLQAEVREAADARARGSRAACFARVFCAAALCARFACSRSAHGAAQRRRPRAREHADGRHGEPATRPKRASRSCAPAAAPSTPRSPCSSCLTLVEPQSSGIGGGAFMLFYDEREPMAASRRRSRRTKAARRRPRRRRPTCSSAPTAAPSRSPTSASAGLPSACRACCACSSSRIASTAACRGPTLFAPAIELAENGFEVSPRLFGLLDGFKRFARGEDFRRYFYDANGEPHAVGLSSSRIPSTPRRCGCSRRAARSRCTRASSRRRSSRRCATTTFGAGRMTLEDLAATARTSPTPLCSPYRTWRVCGPQLPSSGGVTTQQMLGMLRALRARRTCATNRVTSIHLIAEASRLAFADRNLYLGDPQFVAGAGRGAARRSGYLDARAALDRSDAAHADGRARRRRAGARPGTSRRALPSERPSTSHFSIVDRFGDARRDDDERAGRVRQPAHGRRLHPEQPAHGLRLRARRSAASRSRIASKAASGR